MRWQWTIDTDGQPMDVVLDADPETPIELIAETLELPLATIAPGAAEDSAAAEYAPYSGTILPLRNYRPDPVAARGPVPQRSTVRSGDPAIGRAVARRPGDDNDLQLPDPTVSRHHLVVAPDPDGIRITPVENAGPVRVNGEPLEAEGRLVEADDLIEVGASVLSVGGFASAPADVWRDGSGDLAFNRPSRIPPGHCRKSRAVARARARRPKRMPRCRGRWPLVRSCSAGPWPPSPSSRPC